MKAFQLSKLSNKELKERYLMLKNTNNYYSNEELSKLLNYLTKNNLVEAILC